MILKKTVFGLLLAFFTFHTIHAQVLINEFSCANKNVVVDNFGEYDDWIELYNAGPSPVDLTGYYLSDNKNIPTKWQIPSGIINAGEFRLFIASSKDTIVANFSHTNFKLKQTANEEIVLANPMGSIIDSITIHPTQLNHSIGRTTDGATTWSIFDNPTANTFNTNANLGYAPKPTFNVAPGFYSGTQTITINSTDPNCTIRYTTNGKDPLPTSTLYTGPLTVSATTLFRARCFSSNALILPSFIESNTYFIDATHTLPIISVGGDFAMLFSSWGLGLPSSFEYYDKTGAFQFEGYGESDKHGTDSWSYPQKGIDYVVDDEYGYTNEFDYQLFHTKSRQKFERLILKAAGSDNYTGFGGNSCHIRDAYIQSLAERAGFEVDSRTSESCILYVNGAYWGIYEMREKTNDPDYTAYYYGQQEEDIDLLSYWGGLTVRYGSSADWYDLYNFITTNSMAVQSNYDLAAERIEMMSVIDYMIINTWSVNSDWINWNSTWWRGNATPNVKWRYANWDMDNTFNLGQNYSNWPTTEYTANPCGLNSNFTNAGAAMGHFDIFNSLMQNAQFKNLFLGRYTQLNQTYFSSSYAITFLDSMVANIAPEMPAQIARWGGNMATWQNNVQLMKDQITGRCAVIAQGVIDCYGVWDNIKETSFNNVAVFPNPSNGYLTIGTISKIKQVNLFDLCGREIEVNYQATTNNNISLYIENKGVYLIQLTDNYNNISSHKVIVN